MNQILYLRLDQMITTLAKDGNWQALKELRGMIRTWKGVNPDNHAYMAQLLVDISDALLRGVGE